MFSTSAFIFRRDFRLPDNTALLAAARQSKRVMTVFIADPRQVDENPYLSRPALQFMSECIEELSSEIRAAGGVLCLLYGTPAEILPAFLNRESVEAVFVNTDCTPFAAARDRELQSVCEESGIAFEPSGDYALNEWGRVLKSNGTPYTVFSPFHKASSSLPIPKPRLRADLKLAKASETLSLEALRDKLVPKRIDTLSAKGGRKAGLALLAKAENLFRYERDHDYPALPGTTKLSAHLKFGTCSIREVFHRLANAHGAGSALVRQLYWRDFFYHIAFHFPYVFGHAFHKQYDRLEWLNSRPYFDAWCNGRTGFPIVDAAMRELNATGYMHNRCRLIVGSFLVKDLLVDWRWGEKYFAKKLTDYDPSVNNGNWQWVASTGCDAQPYFRIFNPWLQQAKFDPKCEYIKRWVPELEELAPKAIHALGAEGRNRPTGYPPPIVDHQEMKQRAERLFAAALAP